MHQACLLEIVEPEYLAQEKEELVMLCWVMLVMNG
jgi:hypothetical protein